MNMGNPPVNIGDEITETCVATGAKGHGIVKVKGFVIFVPEAKPNERYKIRITNVRDKVGFGEIVEAVSSDDFGEDEE